MRLESVQIATVQVLDVAGRPTATGICKLPVDRVDIGPLGAAGDAIVSTRHHGGPDQAIYVYSAGDYAWWEVELGRELAPGIFGENLTLSSFGEDEVMVGDRWEIGDVVLETTAPRIPCATFGARMGDPGFPERFRAARRPGFYARVLVPGTVTAGMGVTRLPGSHSVSVLDLFDLAYDAGAGAERLQRALWAPIAERTRVSLERRLARLLPS